MDVIGIACPADLLFQNPIRPSSALVRPSISARRTSFPTSFLASFLISFLAVSGVGGRWCRRFGVNGILGHHIHRIPVFTY